VNVVAFKDFGHGPRIDPRTTTLTALYRNAEILYLLRQITRNISLAASLRASARAIASALVM